MDANLHLLRLAAVFVSQSPLSEHTVAKHAAGQAYAFRRLRNGCTITVRRANKITKWFSDHWPADLPWPADIPRPAPSPDSPAAEAQRAAQDAARAHPALQLSAAGQIRRPAALCYLLGIDLAIYYQATSQYAEGRPRAGKTPRKGSGLAALVAALALVGDRRFAARREMAQLALAMPGSALRQRLAPLLEAA